MGREERFAAGTGRLSPPRSAKWPQGQRSSFSPAGPERAAARWPRGRECTAGPRGAVGRGLTRGPVSRWLPVPCPWPQLWPCLWLGVRLWKSNVGGSVGRCWDAVSQVCLLKSLFFFLKITKTCECLSGNRCCLERAWDYCG